MGTSGSSKGPGSRTPLLPTWLDTSGGGGATGDGSDGSQDNGSGNGTDGPATPSTEGPRPAIAAPATSNRYRAGRSNFTTYAKSGGNNTSSMRKSVRDYVRTGSNGKSIATQKMGSARTTASNMLGILQSFQSNGISQTLANYKLNHLVGRPIEDVFAGLTDVVCKDGGSIDEGIARDAWLETIIDLSEMGITDLDALTESHIQIQEIFFSFIALSIEKKLIQEIGAKALKVADDIDTLKKIEDQLSDYIKGAVKDTFSSGAIKDLQNLTDQEIKHLVDKTYNDTWDLLITLGDAEDE